MGCHRPVSLSKNAGQLQLIVSSPETVGGKSAKLDFIAASLHGNAGRTALCSRACVCLNV